MYRRILVLSLCLCGWTGWAQAENCQVGAASGLASGVQYPITCDNTGSQRETLSTLLAGEDQTNNVLRVEHQYSRGLSAGADTLIKSGAGFVHGVTCWGSDAAATAGDIAIRDATSAGAGTIILDFQIAAALLLPQPVILDVPVTTGIYADYTTTADVTCTFSYR